MSRASSPLAVDWSGSGSAVVFLHGFTQTGRSWRRHAESLAERHRVGLVDLPGHGGSGDVVADLDTAADLIVEACGPAVYVGYSLGGRHALHVALRHRSSVRGLVLVGATAGIDDPAERSARVASDGALADSIEADGVDTFLESWIRLPLFAGLSSEAADLDDRRRNTASGLAASLRAAGTGTQTPSWDRLGALTMPALVTAGALDTKFVTAGRRLADAIGPSARFDEIAESGHSAHLEQPEAFGRLLAEFVAAVDGDDRTLSR